jgi:hypothetical protein
MSRSNHKHTITADELIRKREEMLRNDPEYRAKVEAVEAERRARAQALRDAEAPIVEDLHAVGVNVASVWDLVNTAEPYHAALPVLMEHLERGGYPERVMESLGRALAVKPSVEYWARLKARYLSPSNRGEEEGTAVALAACATSAQLEDLIGFLSLEEAGESRLYFIRPIVKVGGDRGGGVVEALRGHPLLGKEATAALKRRRK